jgi:hypothetical protein
MAIVLMAIVPTTVDYYILSNNLFFFTALRDFSKILHLQMYSQLSVLSLLRKSRYFYFIFD